MTRKQRALWHRVCDAIIPHLPDAKTGPSVKLLLDWKDAEHEACSIAERKLLKRVLARLEVALMVSPSPMDHCIEIPKTDARAMVRSIKGVLRNSADAASEDLMTTLRKQGRGIPG